jgi:hypothetical protein
MRDKPRYMGRLGWAKMGVRCIGCDRLLMTGVDEALVWLKEGLYGSLSRPRIIS